MTMLTIEAVATIDPDGIVTVKASKPVPQGLHRVVVIIDEEAVVDAHRGLPDLAEFRAGLGVVPHPGNTVLEAREDERA